MNILVVDMIEGFTRKGALASPRIEALIPKQVAFLKQVPDDSFVVFACDSHLKEDSEFNRMPIHCLAGTEETNICHELMDVVLERGLEYKIIPKTTHSAFYQTDLDWIIDSRDNKWIVFGCVTDICIAANVMELDYRGKHIVLLRDLIDTYEITPEQAEAMGNKACTHNAEAFNTMFFDYYLTGVWGATLSSSEQCLELEQCSNVVEEACK